METWYICAYTGENGEIKYRVVCVDENMGVIVNCITTNIKLSFECINDYRTYKIPKYGTPMRYADESADGKYLSTINVRGNEVVDDKMRILYKEEQYK